MANTITLHLDGGEVIIAKLPLGKYAELFKAIKELPKKIKGLVLTDKTKMIEIIPQLMGEAMPDVINILEIATPLKREEIEALGLDEATQIMIAILQVNNYSAVYEMIKKALARPTLTK